jgi:hypothetical protein
MESEGTTPFKSLRQTLNPHISRKLLTPFAKDLLNICRLFPRNRYPQIMQACPCSPVHLFTVHCSLFLSPFLRRLAQVPRA